MTQQGNSLTRVTVHTDGACSGNPGPGGWGVVIIGRDGTREYSGGDPQTTNNRMELTAAIEGLRHLLPEARVLLRSDEGWGEETGSANFIDPNDPDNARRDWSMIEAGSAALSRDDDVAMVPVGDALYLAATRPGSPEVYESDHHHPSESGAYLDALIWYRWLTGRDGVQAGYRPLDMSETTAQALVRLEQDTAAAQVALFPRG